MTQPETKQFTLRGMFILVTAIAVWLGLSLALKLFGFALGGMLCVIAWSHFYKRSWLEMLIGLASVGILFALLLPSVTDAHVQSNRSMCASNLRQISLALKIYHNLHGSYPPIVSYSATGRPMHSWRTHLLPIIEQPALAAQYDWTEPWNGPLNSRMNTARIRLFQCPRDLTANKSNITYLAIDVPGAQPGDPFVVIEVHGSGVGFFEPRDVSLTDLLAAKPRAGAILPRGVHTTKTAVQLVWPDGQIECIAIADLPKLLAKLQLPRDE